MGSPGQYDLRTLNGLMLLDGDEVGKGLQGMDGGCLHSEDGTAGVLDKLLQYGLCIVVFTIGETSKRTDTDKIAVAAHDGDGLKKMLALVAIHDNATLRFQFPGTGIDIEHDDIHAEVHSCLLSRESGSQRVVEEYHHERFVLAQMLILITVVFDLLCFGEGFPEVAEVLHINETLHFLIYLFLILNHSQIGNVMMNREPSM